MQIQVIGQTVEIKHGQIRCDNSDLRELLTSAASEEGFSFGQFFRSQAGQDNFTGQKLADEFGGQVISLDEV